MKSSSYHVGTLKPLAWQSAWCSWPRRWGSESSAVHVRKGAWETASVRAREKPRPWGRVRSYRPRRPAWSRWPRRCRRCHSRPCGRAWRGRPRRCRGSVSSTAHIDVSPVWRQYYCKMCPPRLWVVVFSYFLQIKKGNMTKQFYNIFPGSAERSYTFWLILLCFAKSLLLKERKSFDYLSTFSFLIFPYS